MTRKIGVILAGSGYLDGAEIQEAVMTLYAIAKHGAQAVCFAPDKPQAHVVNHLTGDEVPGESRNVLAESARIARGAVSDVKDFNAASLDALMLPGGFGAAKNLSTFAFDGPDMSVDVDVAAAVTAMREAGKPIGALCIAPAIMAKILDGPTLTIGRDESTAEALHSLGATHKSTDAGEIVIDFKHKLVTSPCYMLDSDVVEIQIGAENTVKAVLDLV